MKKVELLAPAGNMKALKAAVMAGCDAVYLGGKKFGARAFSINFSDEEIVEAIKYCHLYGVRVYVTVNTLIYENEVNSFLEYVEFLHRNNVDALIIQDFGMFDLVRKTYPNLELHASTQMHIHNLDGVKLMERLGMKRVVLARETSIDDIIKIKKDSNVELEVFVHGALCISYSGQCLMSSLIGGRSGNRGACAGSCRLKYDVFNDKGVKLNKGEYPLSTKDLNSLENVSRLIEAGIDSFKIEGRMKSLEYVYMVVSLYRMAIDSYYRDGVVNINYEDIIKLKKIFNRDYTKGFLFNTENSDLINGYRPNHMGVSIGTIVEYKKGFAEIKLHDNISIGCGLRVIGRKRDVGINVNDFYIGDKLVKSAGNGDTIKIKVKDEVFVGDKVVITLDKELNDDINNTLDKGLRKVNISGYFYGHINEKCYLKLSDGINKVCVYGNVVDLSVNRSVDRDMICNKLSKLGDSVYRYDNLDIDIDDNIFIPISEINNLRRRAIDKLNELRLYKIEFKKEKYYIDVPNFKKERLVSCFNYDNSKLDRKYDLVYSHNGCNGTIKKLPRVINNYDNIFDRCMVGEIGAFNRLRDVDTDFSLNVVNSYTVAFLHSLGARRVTLSYELSDLQIKDLIDGYEKRYGVHPNLELIVSAYEEVMISKFSLNKYYKCDKLYLRDMFGNKYRVITRDDLMYIYNYKKRYIYDVKYYDMGINSLRFNID